MQFLYGGDGLDPVTMESQRKVDKSKLESGIITRKANCVSEVKERKVNFEDKPFKDITRPIHLERLWDHVRVRLIFFLCFAQIN